MHKIIVLLFLALSTAAWGQASNTTQISREDKLLQLISLGGEDSYIKSQRIEMAAGLMAPVHSHPVPTFGVVNQGEIILQFENQDATILKEGDVFFEPPNARVLQFGNHGTSQAVFTVFYIVKYKNSITTEIK